MKGLLPGLVIALVGVAPAWAGLGPEEQPVIFGGQDAHNCQFPGTVAIRPGGGTLCSGTLIHPRVVVTAGHCLGDPTSVRFGETSGDPAHDVPIEWCIRNPEYNGNFGGTDFAVCKLTQAVAQTPPTPPLMGCETALMVQGQPAVIVGFGQTDGNVGAGTKRWAETAIAQDASETTVLVGGDGKSPCFSDSGGPAYLQLEDGSWRAFGIVSGGNDCQNGARFVNLHSFIEWVEDMTLIDVTPCHDVDGTWNASDACTGFATDPLNPETDWDQWCPTARSGSSRTCGPAFDDPPDDDGPTVTIESPRDADAFPSGPQLLDVLVTADDGAGWGVVAVDLLVDGEVVATDAKAPWAFEDQSFEDGVWELTARGRDWYGNEGDSMPVVIQVGEPDQGTDTGTDTGETGDGSEGTDTGEGETDAGVTGESGTNGADGAGEGCGCQSAPSGSIAVLVLLGFARRRRIKRCAG